MEEKENKPIWGIEAPIVSVPEGKALFAERAKGRSKHISQRRNKGAFGGKKRRKL